MTAHPKTMTPAGAVHPDGPGRVAPGQRVTCLLGSLPAREGGRGGGILVSIGPKTSLVDVYSDRPRRIPNELLHPNAGPWIAADRGSRGLRTATASGLGWLPGWSWLGWTVAEHLEYQHGRRQLPVPPPAPRRLVIVACGARKADCVEAPAGQMYTGSYHRAARRAADAIADPGTRIMILSARYGLLDLDDRILRYQMRLGHRFAITAQGLREQAEQLGVLDTVEVMVLAPAAYAALATHVWPHARLPLAGTRGIGDQMARFAALATGRATVASLTGSPAQPPAPPPAAAAATSAAAYARRRPAARAGCPSAMRRAARRAPSAPLPAATGPDRRNRSTRSWGRLRPGTDERMVRLTQAPTGRSPPSVGAAVGPRYHFGANDVRLIHRRALVVHRTATWPSAHNARPGTVVTAVGEATPAPGRPRPREVGPGTQQRHRRSVGSGPTRALGR